jgi:hypothetical protein
MAGLGARKTNADTKYFVSAQQDSYVSGGVAAGPVMVRFPGLSGENGYGLDSTALLVWAITGAAIAVVLGIHFSFGR